MSSCRRKFTIMDVMQGISKNLVSRAFPSGPERPDYLTSEEFLKFTPTEDFMSLPGEIFRTEFRLVVTHEGWEYTVLERELGAHVDPLRKMLVTVSPRRREQVRPVTMKVASTCDGVHIGARFCLGNLAPHWALPHVSATS